LDENIFSSDIERILEEINKIEDKILSNSIGQNNSKKKESKDIKAPLTPMINDQEKKEEKAFKPRYTGRKIFQVGSETSYITHGDDLLEDALPRAKIKVFGVGGAGCNTATNLYYYFKNNKNSDIVDIYAVNTDVFQLRRSKGNYKVLIGRKLCKGYGAGNDPRVGEAAMKESLNDLKPHIEEADLIFVTCGLGGGTGSGAAPVILEAAKELGKPTVAVCTLPFSSEGKKRFLNANWALERITKAADTYILISNDKLVEIVPTMSIIEAFKLSDEVLVTAVSGIVDMIIEEGLVNVELADVIRVLKDGKLSIIGIGEADSSVENRGIAAVQKALNNPLLDLEITTAKKALVNISGDPNLVVKDINEVLSYISSRIDADSEGDIIWGFFPKEELRNVIRITVILTGIETFPGRKEEIADFPINKKPDLNEEV